jgi:prepilin-type N-terminal cleavage/methylation domain-containing protein
MRTSNRQAGFSLAEMLVATAIGAFGLAGVAALIGHGIQLQANARSSTLGVNLAVAELEVLRTLPPTAPQRADGGSLTANVANHFAVRGTTTLRWVIADGPACGPPVMGGPVACAKSITVRALPNTALAAATTVQSLVWR